MSTNYQVSVNEAISLYKKGIIDVRSWIEHCVNSLGQLTKGDIAKIIIEAVAGGIISATFGGYLLGYYSISSTAIYAAAGCTTAAGAFLAMGCITPAALCAISAAAATNNVLTFASGAALGLSGLFILGGVACASIVGFFLSSSTSEGMTTDHESEITKLKLERDFAIEIENKKQETMRVEGEQRRKTLKEQQRLEELIIERRKMTRTKKMHQRRK